MVNAEAARNSVAKSKAGARGVSRRLGTAQ
jgi:hypothetical protein